MDLQEMLDVQQELNSKVIKKLVQEGEREDYLGSMVTRDPDEVVAALFDAKTIKDCFKSSGERLTTNSNRAFWCRTYAQALQNEVVEFLESAGFKFWSKDKLCDLQNLKVELIDMLHFWLSLCLLLGMDKEDIVHIYKQKLGINHERADSGTYSRENKTEDDNKSIDTDGKKEQIKI